MRLFEVAGSQFQDDLANVLKVMQGRADTKRTTSIVPWPAINNMLRSQGYGEITQDIMAKVKNQVDPKGELIQDVTPQGIVLKTQVSTPEEPAVSSKDSTAGKSIDQMASNAASAALK
jgi:hypothetical protein